MSSKIGILIFVTFFMIIQIRNSYKLYKKRQNKDSKFYINLFAIITTFIISFWVLYNFVYK